MTRVAAFVAVAAVAFAGCGGGDDSSTTPSTTTTAAGATGASGVAGPLTTSSLSKDQWIEAADNVCKQTNDAINADAQQALPKNPSNADLTKFATETAIPQTQSELNQIHALGAPSGDEDEVQAILDSAQEALDKFRDDPTLILSENAGGTFDDADQLATAYGLKDCGSD